MSDYFWRPSDDQRRSILLLEVAGLLHDVGKLSDGFLTKFAKGKPTEFSYNHELIADPGRVFPHTRGLLDKILHNANDPATGAPFKDREDITNVLQSYSLQDWNGQTYTLAELLLARFFFKQHPHKQQRQLVKILGKSFQAASLIHSLHGITHYEKEESSSSNQQPFDQIYSSSPFGREVRVPVGNPDVSPTNALKQLPLSDIPKALTTKRLSWLKEVKDCLTQGVADTRRPTNEVSLWDWGYAVASMTKAAAVWIFKNGWPTKLDDLPYRVLRVNLDILELYTHSDKISDLLGIRAALKKAFDRVQTLLEEKYALGNRIHHDETGAYYLLPDIFDDPEMAALRKEVQLQFPPDLRPRVYLGDRITAGELGKKKQSASKKLVAEPRTEALSELSVHADNNLYLFGAEWQEGRPENAEICTVCGVRSVGFPRKEAQFKLEQELAGWATQDKAEQRNICRVCLDRRGRRAAEWARQGLRSTIWTDEVADENGHLALFVGKLGLKGWLDGSLLTTIQVTNNKPKNPSPARLYRITEAARTFWRQICDSLTLDVVGQRPFRLALYSQEQNLPSLGDFHAYALNIDGLALSVVWDKPNGRFLTVMNLSYLAKQLKTPQDKLADRLRGQTFKVLEPSSFQQLERVLFKTRIKEVKPTKTYQPTIPLLVEPSVFMSLVPADKALMLARAVKREYEEQMGKVRDRLPLHLGLVFCRRRTPIRALLEAGQAMLNVDACELWEGWRLTAKNSLVSGECELVFNNRIVWRVPVMSGDGKIQDEWYPRMYEGDIWNRKKAKHVYHLRVRSPKIPPDKGWKIWTQPSRFDFEFLDTNARRFEIYYDSETGRRPRHTRPFYLEDLDLFKQLWELMRRLQKTQRHQVIHTLEATREAWYGAEQDGESTRDPVFRQFVKDTLAGAAWPKGWPWISIPETLRSKLIEAGVRGELADLAELHMEL